MKYVWKEIETEEEFLETFGRERLDIIPRTSVARDFSRPCKKSNNSSARRTINWIKRRNKLFRLNRAFDFQLVRPGILPKALKRGTDNVVLS